MSNGYLNGLARVGLALCRSLYTQESGIGLVKQASYKSVGDGKLVCILSVDIYPRVRIRNAYLPAYFRWAYVGRKDAERFLRVLAKIYRRLLCIVVQYEKLLRRRFLGGGVIRRRVFNRSKSPRRHSEEKHNEYQKDGYRVN